MQQKQNILGFTLVELIVVITIVGILSTVGFVSYSGYLTGARDSNRISQLTKLSDSLQVYSASKTLPLPDSKIDITASGSLIAYQGEVGVDVLETIDYTNGGKDPKDDSYYTYYLTKDRNSLQLMAMMEEQTSTAFNLTKNTNAVNYEERYPKVYGRKLGVLTYNDDTNTDLINTPANLVTENAGGLDILITPINYIAHISDETSDKLIGTGSTLMVINPKASCKRIKQTGGAGDNGTYTISPLGTNFNVYCDMETEGGGWTMIGSKVSVDNSTKGSFGTFDILRGTNVQASIDQIGMRVTSEKVMICSTENCWSWPLTNDYRDCLVSGCANANQNHVLTRVSGNTGASSVTTIQLIYNLGVGGYSFALNTSGNTFGVGSPGTFRYPMDGVGPSSAWESGDRWEIFIK